MNDERKGAATIDEFGRRATQPDGKVGRPSISMVGFPQSPRDDESFEVC